ncbi:hypothetical protein KUCAC02_001342, partial [Chaenocephalus aceratus]
AAADWTAALLPPDADTLSRRGIGTVRSGPFPRSWDKLEPRDTENSADGMRSPYCLGWEPAVS